MIETMLSAVIYAVAALGLLIVGGVIFLSFWD